MRQTLLWMTAVGLALMIVCIGLLMARTLTACGPACGARSACATDADCATSAAGHKCVGGACGCAAAADCPAGLTCAAGTCAAGVPGPTLSADQQDFIQKYAAALYPSVGADPTGELGADFWRTLDFFYGAQPLDASAYARDAGAGIGLPDNTSNAGWNPTLLAITQLYRAPIPPAQRSLNDAYNALQNSSVLAQQNDIISVPFTGMFPQPNGDAYGVNGVFVNRYDPQDLFGPTNVGYCKTGSHRAEFATALVGAPGTSAYHITARGADGEILGFRDNVPFEVVHTNTHGPVPTTLANQFYDSSYAKYGVYYYMARGSGLFFNPKRVLNVRNKVEAIRRVIGALDKLPAIDGVWGTDTPRKAGDPNPFKGKMPNTYQGYLNLVQLVGIYTTSGTGQQTAYAPDFSYTTPGIVPGQPTHAFDCNKAYTAADPWCASNPSLEQYTCCTTGAGGSAAACAQGGSYGGFVAGTDAACHVTWGGPSYSWAALRPLVPATMPGGAALDTDAAQLAWLFYVMCNGIDAVSGEFANPWGGTAAPTAQQTAMLLQMVSAQANLGGVGDDLYIVGLQAAGYDTVVMVAQPESNGCLATEVLTVGGPDGTSAPWTSEHPTKKVAGLGCAIRPSPAYTGTGTWPAARPAGHAVCTSSSGDPGYCLSTASSSTCRPPEVLVCGTAPKAVSWATPQLSFPVYPAGGVPALDVTAPLA